MNFEVHSSRETSYISEKEELDKDNEIHEEPDNQRENQKCNTLKKIELKINTEETVGKEKHLRLS